MDIFLLLFKFIFNLWEETDHKFKEIVFEIKPNTPMVSHPPPKKNMFLTHQTICTSLCAIIQT